VQVVLSIELRSLVVTVRFAVAQGTYTINPNCKGELTIPIPGPPFQLTWDLVVADLQGVAQGKEFYAVGTVPGAVSTFTAKRIQ
jgi:hypothetical protein